MKRKANLLATSIIYPLYPREGCMLWTVYIGINFMNILIGMSEICQYCAKSNIYSPICIKDMVKLFANNRPRVISLLSLISFLRVLSDDSQTIRQNRLALKLLIFAFSANNQRNKIMPNLDQTLLERSCRYGSFEDVASRTARIYHHMVYGAPQFINKRDMSTYYEALHMIAMKVARLVNGTINDADSWRDIAGYAMLVHNQIEAEQEEKTSQSAFATADHAPLDTHPAIHKLDDKIAQLMDEGAAP